MTLRKIAVLGGNGFVGRHVLAEATGRGLASIGIVRSSQGAAVVRALGAQAVEVLNLERESVTHLVPVLASCDGLVYTASVSTGAKAADRTDPAGLVNVLSACREAGVPRVVLFSGLGIAHYGMNPHCTNPYFLAKMAGEVAAFRSSLSATILRPSYIFGFGDEFLTPLLRRTEKSADIEIPGDGEYRLQPIAVEDAARAVLGALEEDDTSPRAVDLVGPEIVSYRDFLGRVSAISGRHLSISERSIPEAIDQARNSGYFGLRPHDLACLLCDEVSDSKAVEALAGGPLEGLDSIISRTLEHVRSGREA